MLILTRKPEQRLIIDDHIIIAVLGVEGDRVKLGITAPAHVSILREEVHREVSGENQRATATVANRQSAEEALRNLRRASTPVQPG